MNLNEYNALRRVTDAVRAADSAFCEDFYNDGPLTEKTFALLKDLLDNLSDLYSPLPLQNTVTLMQKSLHC